MRLDLFNGRDGFQLPTKEILACIQEAEFSLKFQVERLRKEVARRAQPEVWRWGFLQIGAMGDEFATFMTRQEAAEVFAKQFGQDVEFAYYHVTKVYLSAEDVLRLGSESSTE